MKDDWHPLPSSGRRFDLSSRSLWQVLTALVAFACLAAGPASAATLWRIGNENDSSAEFTGSSLPSSYTIPSDWSTRTDWSPWKGSTSAGVPGEIWNTTINYNLSSVPAGGAEFTFKTIEASGMVPEVGVFSNGILAGILQIVGADTPNQTNPRKFGNTYRLYIPKELLQSGANTLRLEKLPPTYNRSAVSRSYLNIEWDYFRLEGLSSVPAEPIHSRKIYLGAVYGSQGFKVDQTRVDTEWRIWEWMGFAYSGNPIRAQFWSNVLSGQPEKTPYLELVRDYNMTAILNRLTDKDSAINESDFIDANGVLKPGKAQVLDDAFADWGDLVQYYELSNEPCMSITHASFAVNKAIRDYLVANAPDHWQITAPGYTYGGGWGLPVDWDAVDANRIDLESTMDATAGHSYGSSYYKQDGLINQTVDTYGTGSPKRVFDGFPKEVVLTECGTHHTSHKDFTNLGMGDQSSGRLRAAMFDKNLRAHIGYADRILNFAMWNRDAPFRMFDGDRGDPSTWTEHVYPLNSEFQNPEVQNKLQIFRRLAAAYATHGRPLTWTYRNASELTDKLVYFRAVDTSTLAPQAGSGATSDKVILNFINFHHTNTETMRVTVTLPASGDWEGIRFDSSPSYNDARSEVSLSAGPTVDLDVTVGPLETVQYLLTPPEGSGGGGALPAVADTYLQRFDGTPNGAESEILVKAETGTATTERLGLIRFDVSGLSLPVSSAALDLTATDVGGNFDFRLLGVKENNGDENFDESTLHWNNSTLTDGSDDGFINSQTTFLADFSLLSTDGAVSLSAPALTDFVNADTDGTVTLMLQRLNEAGAVSRFASGENGSAAGPALSFNGGSGGGGGGGSADLFSRWRFENNGANEVAGGNSATLFGGAGYSSASAEGTRALDLSGSSDYASLGSVALPAQFSFEAWVYLPTGASNIQTVMANAGGGASTDGFRFMVNSWNTSDGRVIFEAGNGSSGSKARSTVGAFDFGAWNHIAVTVDRSTGTAAIFVGGVDVTEDSSFQADFDASRQIRLGRMTDGGWGMNGRIDDLRFYDGLADFGGPEPVGRWLFDNSEANAIAGAPDASLNGGATYTTSSQEGSHALDLAASGAYAGLGSWSPGDQFTFEAWVYLPSGASNIRSVLANSGGGASADGFRLFVNSWNTTDGRINLETGNGSSGDRATSTSGAFQFGQWNHIAVAVDRAAGTAVIYRNGSDVTDDDSIRSDFKNTGGINAGRMTNGQWFLGGRIDDLRIYDEIVGYAPF